MISIIFYGSYPLSLALLNGLLNDSRFSVKLVVTAPPFGDSPRPILGWLSAQGFPCPVLTPTTLKKRCRSSQLDQASADFVLACAYSLKIPIFLRDRATVAALNVHPSLLPQYRGPDPLRRVIMAGEDYTGITLLKLTDEFDAGAIHGQWKIPLPSRIHLGSLYEEICQLTVENIPDALIRVARSHDSFEEQNEEEMSIAPSVLEDERHVHPGMPVDLADRIVRANYPFSPAFFVRGHQRLPLSPLDYSSEPYAEPLIEIKNDRMIFAGPEGCAEFLII
jgi:methionyl-tRNA formyltransferase